MVVMELQSDPAPLDGAAKALALLPDAVYTAALAIALPMHAWMLTLRCQSYGPL